MQPRKCCHLRGAEEQAAGKEPFSHSSVTLKRTDFMCPDLQRASQECSLQRLLCRFPKSLEFSLLLKTCRKKKTSRQFQLQPEYTILNIL